MGLFKKNENEKKNKNEKLLDLKAAADKNRLISK